MLNTKSPPMPVRQCEVLEAVFTAAEIAPIPENNIPQQRQERVPSQNPYFINSGSYFSKWMTVTKYKYFSYFIIICYLLFIFFILPLKLHMQCFVIYWVVNLI